MIDPQFEIVFEASSRGKAQCPANPEFPDGIDLDVGKRPACKAALPYPAPACGTWIIHCTRCEIAVACTAAGRADDPRSMMVPCRRRTEN